MPQSEMETLMQLQKETIESLRQLVDSQRVMIEQMAKSHEEQTAQLNQTIANLNETVEYLKKKLFASSSEKTKKDGFPGLWSKSPALCRMKTGTAPTAMLRWRPSGKRSYRKNCGSSPRK